MKIYATTLVKNDFITGKSKSDTFNLFIIEKKKEQFSAFSASVNNTHTQQGPEDFINSLIKVKKDATAEFNGSAVKDSIVSFMNKFNVDYLVCTNGEWDTNKSKPTFLSTYQI